MAQSDSSWEPPPLGGWENAGWAPRGGWDGRWAISWVVSGLFQLGVLGILGWSPWAPYFAPRLSGNPQVVTLTTSPSVRPTAPAQPEPDPPEPLPEPLEPEQRLPPIRVQAPPVPEQDSLEALQAVMRNGPRRQEETLDEKAQAEAVPLRRQKPNRIARLSTSALASALASREPTQREPMKATAARPRRLESVPVKSPRHRLSPQLVRRRPRPQVAVQASAASDVAGNDPTRRPRPRFLPQPEYPEIFPRPEGTVELALLVGKDGRVKRVRMIRSSGTEALDQAALEAVRRWVFEPARRGQEKVEAWVRVRIHFRDEPEPP